MLRNLKHILLTLVFSTSLLCINAQDHTNISISIEFDAAPTNAIASITPLRYNKEEGEEATAGDAKERSDGNVRQPREKPDKMSMSEVLCNIGGIYADLKNDNSPRATLYIVVHI